MCYIIVTLWSIFKKIFFLCEFNAFSLVRCCYCFLFVTLPILNITNIQQFLNGRKFANIYRINFLKGEE